MTDSYKELKKLRRYEILELLLEVTKRNEELEQKLADAEHKLAEKNIIIEKCGSIAEAAMELNKVFEAAQKAADQYVASVKNITEISADGGKDEQ